MLALPCILWSLLLQAIPPVGRTDPGRQAEDEARELYAEGSRRFDLGEYDEAVAAFKRAYALSHASGLLFNIAQAYRLKGPAACAEALRFYTLYRQDAPAASNRVETEERIEQMKKCVEEGRAAHPAPRSASPSGLASGTPAQPQSGASIAPPRREPGVGRALGWVGIGVGAAGVVLATVAGAMAVSAEGDLARQCPQHECPSGLRSEIDRYDALRNATTAGLVVGGVGLGAGLLLLWRAPAQANARTSAQPWLWANRVGLRGTF